MSGNFSYSVKFQRRKTLAVHILADGAVEVRAPIGLPERQIVRFVEERAAWVVKTREKQRAKHAWQSAVEPGAQLWYLGKPRRLDVHKGVAAAVFVNDEALQIFTREPSNLVAVERQLQSWWRVQADIFFRERLLAVCALFPGLAPPTLRLRKMRQRWGSCSRSGQVTLNTELIKLPVALIDYVIAHELCHLFEFNHSPNFYRHLARAVPDWRQREILLKQF